QVSAEQINQPALLVLCGIQLSLDRAAPLEHSLQLEKHRAGELVETHRRCAGIAREDRDRTVPEQRDAGWLPGLERHAVDQKLRAELRKRALHQILVPY